MAARLLLVLALVNLAFLGGQLVFNLLGLVLPL